MTNHNENIVRNITSSNAYVMTDSTGTDWTCPAMDAWEALPASEREYVEPEPFPEETLRWIEEVEREIRAKEAKSMENATKLGAILGSTLGLLLNVALYFYF